MRSHHLVKSKYIACFHIKHEKYRYATIKNKGCERKDWEERREENGHLKA